MNLWKERRCVGSHLVDHVRHHLSVLHALHLSSRNNSVMHLGDVINDSSILVMSRVGDGPANNRGHCLHGTVENIHGFLTHVQHRRYEQHHQRRLQDLETQAGCRTCL